MTTGTCAVCGRTYALRIHGTIRTHGRPHCPGSNQPPAAAPTVDEIVGVDPNWTGDLSTDDYIDRIRGVDPAAEVGNGVDSILNEHPDIPPNGNVVQEMAREHNDLLRMADYRSLAIWAAGMRGEIQARTEERHVRNARYDTLLEERTADAREELVAVALWPRLAS